MDHEAQKIKQHIDTEREQLGRNFDEIEHRVKKATDLQAHFDQNTGLILGAAVGGGFLLSLAFGKSSTSGSTSNRELDSQARRANVSAQSRYPISTHLRRVSETVDNIIGALVGVLSAKLHSFVSDAVPGFREQYDAIDRQRSSSVRVEHVHAKG